MAPTNSTSARSLVGQDAIFPGGGHECTDVAAMESATPRAIEARLLGEDAQRLGLKLLLGLLALAAWFVSARLVAESRARALRRCYSRGDLLRTSGRWEHLAALAHVAASGSRPVAARVGPIGRRAAVRARRVARWRVCVPRDGRSGHGSSAGTAVARTCVLGACGWRWESPLSRQRSASREDRPGGTPLRLRGLLCEATGGASGRTRDVSGAQGVEQGSLLPLGARRVNPTLAVGGLTDDAAMKVFRPWELHTNPATQVQALERFGWATPGGMAAHRPIGTRERSRRGQRSAPCHRRTCGRPPGTRSAHARSRPGRCRR